MKKTIYLFSLLFLLGCGTDSTSPSVNTSEGRGSSTGTGGSLARFTIAKDHLYIATESELYTYSLATASQPSFVSKIPLTTGVETIFSLGDYLYLGTQGGMLIYDIRQANRPEFASNYWHVTSCDPVVANENYAFVTLRNGSECRRGENRLDIIDVQNKRAPNLMRSINMENPIGLGLYNNFLFVCDNGKIKRFDVTTPLFPVQEESTAVAGVFDIIINGDILIAVHTGGVSQYLISNDGTLTLQSTITTN